jgi:hypothetical protein
LKAAGSHTGKQVRTVDLDIDIGAEAVDYKYVLMAIGNLE